MECVGFGLYENGVHERVFDTMQKRVLSTGFMVIRGLIKLGLYSTRSVKRMYFYGL